MLIISHIGREKMFFINMLCHLYDFKTELVRLFFVFEIPEIVFKSRRTTTNFQIDALKFFEYK